MKSLKFLLAALMVVVGFSATAQEIDFNDEKYSDWGSTPEEREKNYLMFSDSKFSKWGETPEQRRENYSIGSYFKEALDAKDFNLAAHYFQHLIENCPNATVNTFTRGVTLYRNKVQRARNVEDRRIFIDSLLFVYDQRIQYFGNDADKGRTFILDAKARDMIVLFLVFKESSYHLP